MKPPPMEYGLGEFKMWHIDHPLHYGKWLSGLHPKRHRLMLKALVGVPSSGYQFISDPEKWLKVKNI